MRGGLQAGDLPGVDRRAAVVVGLLEQEIAISCPVRLIHGEADNEVPLGIALRLVDRLCSADVQLLVLKGGGHRLSEPQEIDAILGTLTGLLEKP